MKPYECKYYKDFRLETKCKIKPYYSWHWPDSNGAQSVKEPWMCKSCGDYWLARNPDWLGHNLRVINGAEMPKITPSWFDALPETFCEAATSNK